MISVSILVRQVDYQCDGVECIYPGREDANANCVRASMNIHLDRGDKYICV